MKIYLDNIDTQSTSGPNSFAKKLAHELMNQGHELSTLKPHVQLSFIMSGQRLAPTALRLDGIYFNTAQDWQRLNEPIKQAHDAADLVIYQSQFNKELITRYFGEHKNSVVIHNGANLDLIAQVPTNNDAFLDPFKKIWLCASSWRPHKRLAENIRYFIEHASGHDCLIVAGKGVDARVKDPRIFYVGDLSQMQLMGIMKRADTFIHLALLDHCPNVVVDARAAGCSIVCSLSGGTHEVAGKDAVVIDDIAWDWTPFELYQPPILDFTKVLNCGQESIIDMQRVTEQYVAAMNSIALR